MPTSAAPAPSEAAFDDKIAQARRFLRAGNTSAAREISDRMLAERPDHGGALIQRSRLESIDDHYRLAREYALSAFRAGAANKRQCLFLLRRLRTFNLIAEFRHLVEHLPPALATDADIAVLVATLYESINEPQSALEIATRAMPGAPDSAELKAAAGFALLNLGRLDEAETQLRECVALDPGYSSAWWHLSRLRKHDAGNNHVDELRRELSRTNDPRKTAMLAFALHRELDELEDYAAAAKALELACSSMRKTIDYDADENDRLFAALKALPTDAARAGAEPQDAPFTPIFIVGMHRSGTSLLEHFLAGHDAICPGGELYEFTSQLRYAADHHCDAEIDLRIVESSGGFDFAGIGAGYIESVDWRRRNGERFVTDKLPSNFMNLGLILRALPNAKILHMSRDPVETCFSNLREPFADSTCRYSYDQTELARHYRQYFALMRHWRQRFPGRIHEVTYTSLVTDPAAELKRLSGHLGLDFQTSMLDTEATERSVSTASAIQVRQKPVLPLRPKWQPYREFLTPMIWRLSDVGQNH